MDLSGITEVKMREVPRSSIPKKLKAHKAADIFPMMETEKYRELRDDIKKNGLHEPIWVYEDKILDGRNRYKACLELRVRPYLQQYTGDDPVGFVWSLNGVRRHLPKAQLTAISVEMLPALEDEALKRKQLAGKQNGNGKSSLPPRGGKVSSVRHAGEATAMAARLTGVGASSVYRLAAIKKHDPKLYADIKSGRNKTPIRKSYDEMKGLTKGTGVSKIKLVDKVRVAAASGLDARQIADKLNSTRHEIHKVARKNGINIQHAKGERRPNDLKTITTIVHGCNGFALTVRSLSLPIEGMSKAQARELLEDLESAMKALSKLKRALSNI